VELTSLSASVCGCSLSFVSCGGWCCSILAGARWSSFVGNHLGLHSSWFVGWSWCHEVVVCHWPSCHGHGRWHHLVLCIIVVLRS